MSDVKWIKVVTDLFDDEKILYIETLPRADSMLVIWFKLLCLAGKQNNGGEFRVNDHIPYTEEMFAAAFRRPVSMVRRALKTFEELGMIETVEGAVTLPNWGKHQSLEKLEAKAEYMRNYMRAYRERQKQATEEAEATGCKTGCKTYGEADGKANVNPPEEEKEIERDKKENIQEQQQEEARARNGSNDIDLGTPWNLFAKEYEQNIGLMPTSSVEQEDLRMFFDEYGQEVLSEFIACTARKHADNPHRYFAALCRKYLGQHIDTPERARSAFSGHEQRKQGGNNHAVYRGHTDPQPRRVGSEIIL